MNKKLTTIVLTTTLLITGLSSSKAVDTKPATLAIIDTALDTTLPEFRGKIVHEVCILDWNSCPNGKNFMEGPGSALMPLNHMSRNGFEHGTQMAYAAVNTNPNIKIVFIRIIGATFDGTRQITSPTTISKALSWVSLNKDLFNIKAVSMSQSLHNLGAPGTNYCPKNKIVEDSISVLLASDIPFFVPSGNMSDRQRISWPACIDTTVSVGGTDQYRNVLTSSNIDLKKLDFYNLGYMKTLLPGGRFTYAAGTSIAAQVTAANWLTIKELNPEMNSNQIYQRLLTTSTSGAGRVPVLNRVIDMQRALNG
jgi:hypothetical protein